METLMLLWCVIEGNVNGEITRWEAYVAEDKLDGFMKELNAPEGFVIERIKFTYRPGVRDFENGILVFGSENEVRAAMVEVA